MSKIRTRNFFCWLAIVFVCLLTYGALIRAEFAFGDDFVFFFSGEPQESKVLVDGRVGFAVIQYLVHRHIHSFFELGLLRFVCLIGFSIFGMIWFDLLRRISRNQIERFAVVCGICTLPCIHTYVALALLWIAPYCAAGSLLSAKLTYDAFGGQQRRKFDSAFRIVGATILMLIVSMTYQAMLSWFWSVVFVFLLDKRFLRSHSYRVRIVKVVACGIGYFIVCFVSSKLFFFLTEIVPKSRLSLTTDPVFKLYWFARIQLPQAFNYWRLLEVPGHPISLLVSLIVSVVVIGGFASTLRIYQSRLPRMGIIALWVMLLFVTFLMTHTHWFVIAAVPQSYRVIAPLGVTSLVMLYWAISQIAKLLTNDRKKNEATCLIVMLIFASAGIWTAQSHSERLWIEPHQTEYRILLAKLRAGINDQIDHIHVVRQGQYDGLVKKSYIECFGRPAFERAWAIESMIQKGLRDSGVKHHVANISNGAGDEPIPQSPTCLVLDMRAIINYRR